MIPKVKKIDPRPNISREIADKVRRMIVEGKLYPGQRINEVHFSAELGVSRTPLREALSSLESEGALDSVPRKGFFVTPLSIEELESIYPIRAVLDPEALRLAGIPGPEKLARLEALNQAIAEAKGVEKRIRLDDEWHLLLASDCNNPVLLDLINQFIRRTHRYEYGYLGQGGNVQTAVDEHEKIIQALKKGDLEGACRWLKQNMTSAKDPLIKWLKEKR